MDASTRDRIIILAAPLAGTMIGAVAGGLAPHVGFVAAALEKLGGPLLGKLFASSDNLALFGGLMGLALAALLTRGWLREHGSRRDDG